MYQSSGVTRRDPTWTGSTIRWRTRLSIRGPDTGGGEDMISDGGRSSFLRAFITLDTDDLP